MAKLHGCAALAMLLAFFYQLTHAADFSPPYNPVDNILIDCGDSSKLSNIRSNWVGDIDSKFFPFDLPLNNQSVTLQPSDMQFNSANHVPYGTARLSHSQFTYTIPLTPGHKFVRLYLYPARYPNFDRSKALFSLQIGLYTLLRDFNVSANADASNLDVFFREFCVFYDGNEPNMKLTFIPTNQDSYAFINGIEVVSMPSYLYHTPPSSNEQGDRGLRFIGQNNIFFPIENNTFLEMMYRMNIGGRLISPGDDSGMFRTWSEEGNLVRRNNMYDSRPSNLSIMLNYTKIPSYTAPEDVYRTARTMGTNATENMIYNLTWEYPIDPGFFYMIRLHFCEFQSQIIDTNDRVFLIHITHMMAELSADVFRWAGGKGVPIYRDYVVLVSPNNILKKVNLSVELQPNPDRTLTRYSNVILNGVEIFKLNDSNGNLGAQNPNPTKATTAASKSINSLMVAIVSCGCFCLIVFILYLMVIYIRRRRSQSRQTSSTFKKKMMNMESTMNCGPKRYNYSDIRKMTNSFSEKVGEGGYGIVYRGKLENGSLVAVKVLKVSKSDCEDFINEVTSITQTSHVNIVSLLGFSYNSKEIALVYEFMSNGSLDTFITRNQKFEMEIIHRVVVGVAKGLEYLHCGCSTRIVHFDIKPQNILLDSDFNPKISDFGLAKLCKKKESVISMFGLRGTIGFIAPEVFSRAFGIVSYKSDVYSYGMLVLDLLIGGTRNPTTKFVSDDSELHFPSWVFKNFEEGRSLTSSESLKEEEEEMERKMVMVGLWCIQTSPFDRPSMSRVLEMLSGSINSIPMPPKPSFDSSNMSTQQFTTETLSSQEVL